MDHSFGLNSAEAQATELSDAVVNFCFSKLSNYLFLMKSVVAAVSFLLKRKMCPGGMWNRGASPHRSSGGGSSLLP